MTPKEYQQLAARTINFNHGELSPGKVLLANGAIGLTGEAGEVAEELKKYIFHDHVLDPANVRRELGDCLWYVCQISTVLGFSLEEIMTENIEKLQNRYPDAYSHIASKNRVEYLTPEKQGA